MVNVGWTIVVNIVYILYIYQNDSRLCVGPCYSVHTGPCLRGIFNKCCMQGRGWGGCLGCKSLQDRNWLYVSFCAIGLSVTFAKYFYNTVDIQF